ncbi:hypothetical protein SAMD00019534_108670 [Acytostelium subglobosum LB1]|uniref:hypothetical protein n=1 Tax=Acytostelium subglobosum LB1 TaxID=1410327 RepID=UPI000645234F|nr:hypothetical protein SAMD00019534_108670 [Acytostelium subglobosum LB1]GAM27691.1 hypothetical protein SAMD00019534_108670 [Acytostelium subglobosum LB1]|eukprot:XP_012749350.1 hypothetical protein SAMD00019534_108670 [Acytostelium subglobosum LB1]
MDDIVLQTLDGEEVECCNRVLDVIGSLQPLDIANNNAAADQVDAQDDDSEATSPTYRINITVDYIDSILDYVDWYLEHRLDDGTSVEEKEVSFSFGGNNDLEHLRSLLECTKDLDIKEYQSQLQSYIAQLESKYNRRISLNEVLQHQSEDDLWLVINRCVYDVTKTDMAFKKLHQYFIGYLSDADTCPASDHEEKPTEEFWLRLKKLCPEHQHIESNE